MTCPEGHLDGSFVLGALSPDERSAYVRHLRCCAECAESVEELSAVPALLARVSGRVTDLPGGVVRWPPGHETSAGPRSLAGRQDRI